MMYTRSNWRYEKMQMIKDVLKNKSIIPLYAQNKLVKEVDFQLRAMKNCNSFSQSPRKIPNRGVRLKTLNCSPKYIELPKSFSIDESKEDECIKCRKFIFDKKITITCPIGKHYYHEKCLEELLNQEFRDLHSHFECICGNKLSFQMLQSIDLKDIELLIDQFYHQQVNQLSRHITIQRCRNPNCTFFWKIKDSKQKSLKKQQLRPIAKEYCPYCS